MKKSYESSEVGYQLPTDTGSNTCCTEQPPRQVSPPKPLLFERCTAEPSALLCNLRTMTLESGRETLRIFDSEASQQSVCQQFEPEIFTCRSTGYFVDGYFLRGTPINELMRACLNDWLMGSAQEHYFTRQTYALASYYIDAYLRKKATVGKHDLQLIGYTALFLASKMEESYTLKALPHHITKEAVYLAELDLCAKLDYRLAMDTYVYWLSVMAVRWDELAQGTIVYHHTTYLQPSSQSYHRYSTLFQLADCINLDYHSCMFERKLLMFNLFCVVTLANIRLWKSFPTTKQNLVSQLLNSPKELSQLTECMHPLCPSLRLDCQMVQYLHDFLRLEISLVEPNCTSDMYSQFLSLQTHNAKMFPLVKQLVAARKFK